MHNLIVIFLLFFLANHNKIFAAQNSNYLFFFHFAQKYTIPLSGFFFAHGNENEIMKCDNLKSNRIAHKISREIENVFSYYFYFLCFKLKYGWMSHCSHFIWCREPNTFSLHYEDIFLFFLFKNLRVSPFLFYIFFFIRNGTCSLLHMRSILIYCDMNVNHTLFVHSSHGAPITFPAFDNLFS